MASYKTFCLNVQTQAPLWHTQLPEHESVLTMVCKAIHAHVGKAQVVPVEVELVLADDALLHQLNRDFRHKDAPTNVLAFPSDDDPLPDEVPCWGDVVISIDRVVAEAGAEDKPVLHHYMHLVVHGVLHLAGYDHETDAEADVMEGIEVAILADLGVPNPYLDNKGHAIAHG